MMIYSFALISSQYYKKQHLVKSLGEPQDRNGLVLSTFFPSTEHSVWHVINIHWFFLMKEIINDYIHGLVQAFSLSDSHRYLGNNGVVVERMGKVISKGILTTLKFVTRVTTSWQMVNWWSTGGWDIAVEHAIMGSKFLHGYKCQTLSGNVKETRCLRTYRLRGKGSGPYRC